MGHAQELFQVCWAVLSAICAALHWKRTYSRRLLGWYLQVKALPRFFFQMVPLPFAAIRHNTWYFDVTVSLWHKMFPGLYLQLGPVNVYCAHCCCEAFTFLQHRLMAAFMNPYHLLLCCLSLLLWLALWLWCVFRSGLMSTQKTGLALCLCRVLCGTSRAVALISTATLQGCEQMAKFGIILAEKLRVFKMTVYLTNVQSWGTNVATCTTV